MKKIMSLLLTLAILAGVVMIAPVSASAETITYSVKQVKDGFWLMTEGHKVNGNQKNAQKSPISSDPIVGNSFTWGGGIFTITGEYTATEVGYVDSNGLYTKLADYGFKKQPFYENDSTIANVTQFNENSYYTEYGGANITHVYRLYHGNDSFFTLETPGTYRMVIKLSNGEYIAYEREIIILDGITHMFISGLQADVNTQIDFNIQLKNTVASMSYKLKVTSYTKESDYAETTDKITEGTVGSLTTANIISVILAAKNITDEIYLEISLEDEVIDSVTTNVKTYLESIIASSLPAATAEIKNFAEKYLTYGACAQKYFGYDTANPATDNTPSKELDDATITDSYDAVLKADTALGKFYGVSLVLENEVKIKYYYENAGALVTGASDSKYIKTLSVTQFGEALSYCKNQLTKYSSAAGKENLCNLCRAIYDLNVAANACIND